MKNILSHVIEVLFSKIPFSKDSEQLKEVLNQKLVLKYEEDTQNGHEIEVAGKIISECKDIKSVCQLVDHSIDNIEQYENHLDCLNKKDYQKIIRKIKRYNILISLCGAFIVPWIISILCYFHIQSIIFNTCMIVVLFILSLIIAKRKENYLVKKNYQNLKYDLAAQKYIYELNDLYTKKLINILMIDLSFLAYLILYILLSVLLSRYTYIDVLNQISYLSIIIELLFFLTLKDILYKSITDVYFTNHKKKNFHQCLFQLLKYSSIYFIVIIILLCFLKNKIDYVWNWAIFFWLLYFIAVLVFNLTKRKDIVFKNLTLNIKKIVVVSLFITGFFGYQFMSMDLFLTQPYINQVSHVLQQKDDISYNEETGVYTITTLKNDFKVLQLTDIHLGGSVFSYTKDMKSLEACYTLIQHTQPDLVIVTGDLVFPMGIMSFSFNNSAPIMQFANFMRNTGIPWAFTYGNHDTEGMATLDRNEFDTLMKSLSFKTSGNLLYPYIQPDIYGRNNQIIEIRSQDGQLMQALFLIDSNDYIPVSTKINEYDYIHDDQVKWYEKNVLALSKKEGRTIPSMLFFHIPLREYITANHLYENGSSEVQYYYGTLGETMIDKICASAHESLLFDTAVKLKSTKAMFFGHDHYNNQSLEYKGIRMTYGYSIDYLAMPGIEDDEEQRGATLITISHDGDFKIDPYRLMDIK